MIPLVPKYTYLYYGIILLWSFTTPILKAEGPIIATPVGKKKLFKGAKLFQNTKNKSQARQPIIATPVLKPTTYKKPASYSNSLDSLIAEALHNNPELHSARQDEIIQLAKSEFTQKDAFPLLAVYGTHDSQPARSAATGNDSKRDAVGLSAEQALLDWGESRGKIQTERYQAKSHHWNAKVKELETAYRVTEAYWRIVFFDEVIQMRQSLLNAKQREKDSIKERLSAREARHAELLLIEAHQAEAERDLLKAQNGRGMAIAQLLFYLGRKDQTDIDINSHLRITDHTPPAPICIDSHPEMQRVKSAEMAASTAARAARAGRLPKVILRGHIEDSNAQETAGTTNLVPDGTNYQVGAYVSVPVGRQWAGATAKLNEAYARRIQLAADAETLNRSLQLRIKDAQNRVEEALKSVIVAEKNEAAAKGNLNLRKELALIKNATRADVAKAESEYFQSRIGVLKAIYDVKEARAHLDRETGMLNP